MVHVYELRNANNQVEYVGISGNLISRLYEHTRRKPDGKGQGKFYGRNNLTLISVKTYNTRAEARQAETILKLQHGLEPTERNSASKLGKGNRKLTMEQAREIRKLYNTRSYTQSSLAKIYICTQACIHDIVNNKRYKEV